MDDKILLELYVPALFRSYDIFVTQDLKIHEVIALLTEVVNEISLGQYRVNEQSIICERSTGNILDINLSVRKLKLENGAHLMLI